MIEVRKISKKYGPQPVLDQLDITIQKGNILALLGPNGSGKSTLINSIAGLTSSDSGLVLIDDEPVTPKNRQVLKPVGFVFESPIYIEVFSCYEYLDFVGGLCEIEKTERKRRINELMAFLDLPAGKMRIESYSKGMKNKVSVAAALLNKPSYLVLDEPFDGLDFVSTRKIIRLLKNMAGKGVGVLVTSHQYELISEVADELAILKNGKIKLHLAKPALGKLASREFPGFEEADCVKLFLEKTFNENKKSMENLSWL